MSREEKIRGGNKFIYCINNITLVLINKLHQLYCAYTYIQYILYFV